MTTPRRNTKPPVTSRRPVQPVRRQDKRKNIPTEVLRDSVREDQQQPRKVLYPQLVWKGKEQDAQPLELSAVPVYIWEKIRPQAIIEGFRAPAAKVAKARNLWVPAPNDAGTSGRWAFIGIRDLWAAKNLLRGMI